MSKQMYGPKDLVKAFKRPKAAAREINRLFHTRGGINRYNPKGTGIFEKDWDNLIILDACRYDIFKKISDLPGNTNHRYTLASATYEFIPANFSGRKLLNTVYVGANTWFLKLKDEINSEVFKFVDLQSDMEDIEWANEELQIPTPGTVTTHTLEAAAEYPNKRIIAHYLQPHHPFIGPKGLEYSDEQSVSLLNVVEQSEKPDSELRSAYKENLEIVLADVSILLEELEGKTAITADHGEMLGDRHSYVPVKDYGHHPGIFNDATVKVPWHTYKNGERKKIQEDEPLEAPSPEEDSIDERLRHLGYKF